MQQSVQRSTLASLASRFLHDMRLDYFLLLLIKPWCAYPALYSMLRRSYGIQRIQRWLAETLDVTSKHTHTNKRSILDFDTYAGRGAILRRSAALNFSLKHHLSNLKFPLTHALHNKFPSLLLKVRGWNEAPRKTAKKITQYLTLKISHPRS